MRTIPNPSRFEQHDEARAVVTALVAALDDWEYTTAVAAHVWTADGWTVEAKATRSHVDIKMPGGGHAGMHRVGPDEAVAVLRVMGAPIAEDRHLAAIHAAFEGVVS